MPQKLVIFISMKNGKLLWLPFIVVLLVGVALSIRTLHEPDIWWQLRTGEYILEHNQVPDTDVFSYTQAGEPWVNVKWGFEVLMALSSKLGGPEMTVLLQVPATLLIMIFVVGIYRQLFPFSGAPPPALVLSLLVMVFTIAFRLNGRPEMSSHVLTMVYIYLYLRHRNRNDWRILLLIPLQMLWANLHEGYGVGMVLIAIFIISAWMEQWLFKSEPKDLNNSAIRLSIAGVVGMLAVVIHPSGFTMLTQFLDLFGQLKANRFTTELYNFKHPKYWTFAAYVNICVAAIGIVYMLRALFKSTIKQVLKTYSPAYLAVLVAFLYLSLNSNRNIPFFMMAVTPLLAHIVHSWVGERSIYKGAVVTWGMAIVGVVAYVSVVTNTFYKMVLPRESFGLGVKVTSTPVDGARFIEENGLKGKAFVDYLSCNYLLWKLQPEFKTYIDLRDLDVFPPRMIQNLLHCYTRPMDMVGTGQTLWEYLKSFDEFDYIQMLNAPQFQQMHLNLLYNDKEFDLVYADPLLSIYVRVDDKHKAVLDKYGWKTAGKRDVFHMHGSYDRPAIAHTINSLLWPFYRYNNWSISKRITYEQAYFKYIGFSK